MPTYENICTDERISASWTTAGGANSYDAAYSPDGAVDCGGPGQLILRPTAVTNEIWLHFNMMRVSTANAGNADEEFVQMYDNANNRLLRMRFLNNGINASINYEDGGTEVSGGNIFIAIANVGLTVDIRLVSDGGGAGLIEVYNDGTLVWSVTGLNNIGNPIAKSLLMSNEHSVTNYKIYYSEFAHGIGNSPTVGRRFFSAFPTADGVNTGWTGTFADVDDDSAAGDGDFVYTDVAARQSFTFPNVPVSTFTIDTVAICQTVFKGDVTALDTAASINIAGTDYDAAAVGVTGIPKQYETFFPTNPATAGVWTAAAVDAAELGVAAA